MASVSRKRIKVGKEAVHTRLRNYFFNVIIRWKSNRTRFRPRTPCKIVWEVVHPAWTSPSANIPRRPTLLSAEHSVKATVTQVGSAQAIPPLIRATAGNDFKTICCRPWWRETAVRWFYARSYIKYRDIKQSMCPIEEGSLGLTLVENRISLE